MRIQLETPYCPKKCSAVWLNTHTHTQAYFCGTVFVWARYLGGPSILSSFFCFLSFFLLVYQQHHSDVLQFWSAHSLPTNSKEPLHSPSSDDGNGICLDRFIQQESEKRKKCSAGMILVHTQLAPKNQSWACGSASHLSHLSAQTAVKRFTCFKSAKICAFSSA